MNNYQNTTNFTFSVYGDLVKEIDGRDTFTCNLISLPTPEVAISSTTYSKHPLVSKQKGKDPGTVIENDDLLEAELLVDEQYDAYLFALKWLASYATVFRQFGPGTPETIVDVVALSDKGSPLLTFTYHKVIPTRMAQIIPSPQLSSPDNMILPFTMSYDTFSVRDGQGNIIIE